MSTPHNRRIKTNGSLVRLRDDTLVLFKDRVAYTFDPTQSELLTHQDGSSQLLTPVTQIDTTKADALVGAATTYEPPTPPEPNVFYVVDENGVAWLHKPDGTWTLQNDNIVMESWQKLWDAYGPLFLPAAGTMVR